jgi:hypothetical protein
MRRIALVLSVVMVVSTIILWGTQSAAQDATPAPGPVGVTVELLGSGETSIAPGHELSLRRITIEPGGGIPPHTHPGALVIYLESGTWSYTALDGTARLTRAAQNGTPSPTEEMPIGEEVILNPGDWIYVEDPADDIRNTGEEPVVIWSAGLTRVGEPFTSMRTGMDMDATPAP